MDTLPPSLVETELPGNDQLPEELRGPTPREVPDFVRQGRLAVNRRNITIGCLMAGGFCFLLAPLSFIKTMALYLLPLGYLNWVGAVACLVGAAMYFGRHNPFMKACRYIRNGDAAFARVLRLNKIESGFHHGRPIYCALMAQVQLLHPATGSWCIREVKSRDISSSKKDRIKARFGVGDAVAVVWLPNQFDKTLQIYDFLETTPETALVVQRPFSVVQVVGAMATVGGMLFVLAWTVYAFGRYEPIDLTFQQGLWPFLAGAALGLISLVVGYIFVSRRAARLEVQNTQAMSTGQTIELKTKPEKGVKIIFGFLLALGVPLLCGMIVMGWCYTANALFDTSSKQPVNVAIMDMVETTHELIFREYKLEYRRLQDNETHSLLTTPEHLAEFQVPLGIAQIHKGWLGWPWVETVDAVNVKMK